MSVVIVGGHDRMATKYKQICKKYNYKAKVFTQMSADLNKQIGSPDLMVLFTNTVSHKMIKQQWMRQESVTRRLSDAIPAAQTL